MITCSSCVPVVAQAPVQCTVVSGTAQTPRHFTPSRKMLLSFMFSLTSSPPMGYECKDLCASRIPRAVERWKSTLRDAGNAPESSTNGEVVLVGSSERWFAFPSRWSWKKSEKMPTAGSVKAKGRRSSCFAMFCWSIIFIKKPALGRFSANLLFMF